MKHIEKKKERVKLKLKRAPVDCGKITRNLT